MVLQKSYNITPIGVSTIHLFFRTEDINRLCFPDLAFFQERLCKVRMVYSIREILCFKAEAAALAKDGSLFANRIAIEIVARIELHARLRRIGRKRDPCLV